MSLRMQLEPTSDTVPFLKILKTDRHLITLLHGYWFLLNIILTNSVSFISRFWIGILFAFFNTWL